MMKKHILPVFAITLSGMVLTSCQSGSGSKYPEQDTSLKMPVTAPVEAPVTPAAGLEPTGLPQQPAGVALNPEHGQPGHRCDLAVGAPLNSSPGAASPVPVPNQSTPVIQPTGSSTPVTIPATQTAAAPGTNPEHGQPGHRCDLAVGAPLK
ncbi:hypothetical protein JMG10_14460 [Nostoc ellipsosporum NOK]|nr:hypothetical protein [Nostoc ellipsosporum NOK]